MPSPRHSASQDQIIERARELRVHSAILAAPGWRGGNGVPECRIEAMEDGSLGGGKLGRRNPPEL